LEVSGPLSKVNQTHFLEDRNKIAKNLKAMYKYIASKMEVPSLTLLKELKWFGLQVYDNKMHVYSLSKPCEHSYVFSQDVCFPVLDNKSILSHSLPTFIKNITVINDIIKTTRDILDKLFTVDDEQEVLNEYQQVVSPHQSPHKKQKLDD
jgi:hypothetical protein